MNLKIEGDREELVISGEDYNVSDPYKLPKSEYHKISMKPKNGTMMKYVLEFPSIESAKKFKKQNVNRIKFYKVMIVDKNDLVPKYYGTNSDIDDIISSHNSGEVTNKKLKKKLTETEAFASLGSSKSSGFDGNGDDDMPETDIDELLETWEDYFSDRYETATIKARMLLVSVSDHYLTKEIIAENSYVKQRIQISAESLSLMFVQLNLTKQVIMKYFTEIMSGIGTKTTYESFTQQQKLVLEINSFISTTLKDVIEDLSKVKDQHEINIMLKKSEELPENADYEMVGETFKTRDRTALLNDLKNITSDKEDNQDLTREDIEERRVEMEKDARS